MNGDALIIRVRRILRDTANKTEQGEFWSDREIILALNVAQDIFINFCLTNNILYLLSDLINPTSYIPSEENYNWPLPYMHYVSALAGNEANLKPARIYLGAEGYHYLRAAHKSCTILNNSIYFTDGDITPPSDGSGVLYYYTYPSYIGATSLGDNPSSPIPGIVPRPDFQKINFDDFIYKDIFVNHAAVILGLKEITNQRDYKKYKRQITEIMTNPPVYSNFINNVEFTGIVPQNEGQANGS